MKAMMVASCLRTRCCDIGGLGAAGEMDQVRHSTDRHLGGFPFLYLHGRSRPTRRVRATIRTADGHAELTIQAAPNLANDSPAVFLCVTIPSLMAIEARLLGIQIRPRTDSLLLTNELLRPAALVTSKDDELRLIISGFAPGNSHQFVASRANGVFTRVQRIEQEILVGSHN
jgi:hypothetical protein